MSRSYKFTFVSNCYDVATTVGHGNTRRTAERSARRNLPKSWKLDALTWTVREVELVRAGAKP